LLLATAGGLHGPLRQQANNDLAEHAVLCPHPRGSARKQLVGQDQFLRVNNVLLTSVAQSPDDFVVGAFGIRPFEPIAWDGNH